MKKRYEQETIGPVRVVIARGRLLSCADYDVIDYLLMIVILFK